MVSKDTARKCRVLKAAPIKYSSRDVGRRDARTRKLPRIGILRNGMILTRFATRTARV